MTRAAYAIGPKRPWTFQSNGAVAANRPTCCAITRVHTAGPRGISAMQACCAWCCCATDVGQSARSSGGSSTDLTYAFPGSSERVSLLARRRSLERAPRLSTDVSGRRRRPDPRLRGSVAGCCATATRPRSDRSAKPRSARTGARACATPMACRSPTPARAPATTPGSGTGIRASPRSRGATSTAQDQDASSSRCWLRSARTGSSATRSSGTPR